jgi:hypothetical protein
MIGLLPWTTSGLCATILREAHRAMFEMVGMASRLRHPRDAAKRNTSDQAGFGWIYV